jgi:5,10-methylenetetrahydrofolate reductase
MSRPLSEALRLRPLFFEPVPPGNRSNPVRVGLQTEELLRRLRTVPRLDAIDVPELVDENHEGRPYYRTGDPRSFARTLGEQAGCETIVNKVVAHLPSAPALEAWIDETVQRGLRHVVLVGGSSRYIPYPGPPVVEANRLSGRRLAPHGGLVGNIAIPQRTGEAHRMLAKTRAGASFFTTQILFGAEAARRLVREYDRLCRAAGVLPAAVLLSFAPIADDLDAEFVRWLGADIPDSAERAILNGADEQAAVRSVRLALQVFDDVRRDAADAGLATPLGANVEQITTRHLVSAVEMLAAFAREIDGETPARAA